MATKAASKRLGREAQIIEKDPPPFCYARPREDNVLEWHFILRGPPDTPYHGGEYWGQLIFPSDYPFKPPGIKMSTPSGRFKPDTKICTSFSDFHVGSWNPSWSVANILVGLLSFMCADEMTTGSVSATSADRQTFAQRSHAWNIEQRKFKSILPEYSGPTAKDLPNMGQQTPATAAAGESSKKKEGEEGKSSNKVRPAAAASNEQNYVKDAGEPAAAQSSKSTAKETLNQAGAMADTAIAQAPPARVNAGWRMLDIGRRKIAFAVALLAYLFVSRLVSGGSATNGAA